MNSASQYEDSFVEFDTRVDETEETAVSNVPVHNRYETLASEVEQGSTSQIIEFMTEQVQILSRQLDRRHATLTEIRNRPGKNLS